MKIVYFDCFSGISGDMTLSSLVDAGANIEYIERELKNLPIEPFELQHQKIVKKGVTALKIDVVLQPETELVHHRHYTDIINMIDSSSLPDRVKEKSKRIFEVIGKAEGKVHHLPLEKVHFHEVGAVDSIVDIIGVCLALEDLGIQQIYTSAINRFQEIIESVPHQPQQDQELVKAGKVILKQVRQIRFILLSTKCSPSEPEPEPCFPNGS